VAAASVFLGTLYPLFVDALGFGKISVGPPYFNTVFVPIMVPMVLLMGLGPIARWKQVSVLDLWVRVRWAFLVSIFFTLPLPWGIGGWAPSFTYSIGGWGFSSSLAVPWGTGGWAPLIAALPSAGGAWTPMIALGLMLALWIVSTVLVDFYKRLSGREGSVLQRFKSQSLSYYGMQLAHIGVAIFIVGVTMVKGYETERDVRMEIGDTVAAGGYVFRFDGVREMEGPNYSGYQGRVTITEGEEMVTQLYPEKRTYNASGMPMTEAAIDTGFLRDLYVSLGEPIPDSNGAWAVRIYHKPFIDWIWGGCFFMILGGVFAISDKRYRIHARKQKAAISTDKEQTA
jgi:cytochrome c-type biogenesis protein CcmF